MKNFIKKNLIKNPKKIFQKKSSRKISKKSFKFSIKSKLILVMGLLLIIPLLILGLTSYYVAKTELESSGKILLKNSVHMTIEAINSNQKLVYEGKLTLNEAQERVREYMLSKKQSDGTRSPNPNFDLGESGYLLAYTQDGVEAVHPTLEGKNVLDSKDKKTGYSFVKDQIKIANNGGGYLTYWWTLSNSNKIANKITYQKTDPNWGWVISAGTYMDDFNVGSHKILITTLIVLSSVIILGFITILLFAKNISQPIEKISTAVDAVASGNLNIEAVKIKNKDEIGNLNNSFNKMVTNVNEVITSVKSSVDIIFNSSQTLEYIVNDNTSSINEVVASVGQITEASNQQAKETENGAMKIKNLSDKIDFVTQLTIRTNDEAVEASSLSNQGLKAIEQLSEKSLKNNESTEKTSNIIMEVDKTSVEIGAITEAISQISAQTNLLALNAALEAARAGEHGKGFAVVADEVKNLASQSSISAAKVKELISGIQEKSKSAVKAIEDGKTIAKEQNESVIETKDLFINILKSIDQIAKDIINIKMHSLEMEIEKNEIVEILETLSASTEENSAATEEVFATSEQQLESINQIATHTHNLNDLAEKLRIAIEKFNV